MSSKNMHLLDERGFTYRVYDLGNGRVLKREKPIDEQHAAHAKHNNDAEYVRTHHARAKLLASSCSDRELLGHPEFLDEHSYMQDKCTVLDAYFAAHDIEQNTKIIDGFIQCMFDMWANGFSDIIFNCTRNNGVLPNGRVILIDFNEVTFEKSDVLALIESKRWLRSYAYTLDLSDGPLKDYYAEAMERAMTTGNVDLYWKDGSQKPQV